ncbi:hypothetical protein ABZ345_45215 [Lentzea sp. NPDC005914]|uniref:hypothetical protein n=1 Tax=Lentzea sp. NPDC005914 TaxID=3154572 RepID=UPI0033BFFA9B
MKRAAEAGEVLDLSRRGDNGVSAGFLRDLLRADGLDPLGVRLTGARITGELDLEFVRTYVPLLLDDCVFEEPLSLLRTELPALSLDGSTLPGLVAEGVRTGYLGMQSARCEGTVDLDNARIDGPLLLSDSSMWSFRGGGLQVSRSVVAQGLFVRADHDGDALWLDGCDIAGQLDLERAVIVNGSGTALVANNAKIGGKITLDDALLKAGGEGSALVLIDTSAGGLSARATVLRSDSDNAIVFDGTHFRAEVKLVAGFDARSRGAAETIRMIDTRIDAGLAIRGSVRADSGQALSLERGLIGASITIGETVFEADSDQGAVQISDSSVAGELVFQPEKLVNNGDGLELSLGGTKVGGLLALDVPDLLEAEIFTVSVDGLTYPEPPEDTTAWLTMLRDHTFAYHPQPYQQLAAVHRAAGHEHTARKVLIAQQKDLRRRGDPGNRLLHWFMGVTLGYGYRPSRAVAGLLATFALALCLVWTTNAYNGLTPAKDRGPDACSPVNRISLAADLAIPLVKLGGTPRCELANGPAGQWATGAGWVVQILGWSFATLSVAGFTGLVRKS